MTSDPPKQKERQVLREQRLWDALYRISRYEQPERLKKNAERCYGLSGSEVVDMAYENVIQEAKNAIRRSKRPQSVPNTSKSSDATGVSSTNPGLILRESESGGEKE